VTGLATVQQINRLSDDLNRPGDGVRTRDILKRMLAMIGDVSVAGDVVTLTSIGGASLSEPFVTIGNTAGLSAERALTGTSNQIVLTDNGANSTVVLSTPQNLDTAAVFRVGTLGIGGAAAGGNFLDVLGIGRIRDTWVVDQQADRDGLVIHFRSSIMNNIPFRIIDDDAVIGEVNIDAAGFATFGGLRLDDAASAFFLTMAPAVLTANRTITFPNLTATVQVLSGTQSSSATMTWSGAQTYSSATRPLFKAGITIEDPGAGTNTISMIAPAAPTTHILTWPGANAAGVLTNDAAGTLSWAATAPATAHAVLSATHSDTLAAAVTRGDLMVGNATPKWARLAIGSSGKFPRSDGTDVGWASVALGVDTTGTLPVGNGGTGQITALLAFNALSPITTRGDLITRDATNNVRLAIGAANTVLTSSGTDAAWVAPAAGNAAYSPGSFTVATEAAKIMSRHLKLATTERATLAGTATLRMT
jgi:hypothetical protein